MTRPGLHRWLIVTQLISLIAIAVLSFQLARPNTLPYPFIAKRLFVDHPNDVIINFTDLRSQIQNYVSGSSEKIGVYFEYLPTNVSINVNGNEEFYRASLVKLPVVMRAYKYIEDGKLSLDDQLTVEQKQLNNEYGSLWKRGVGTTISVRELIRLILTESDNTAFNVLYEKVNVQLGQDLPSGDNSADDIYDYLDIPRASEGITPMISPRNYSSILKSLFFSAYLSYQHSNEILSTMALPHSENWLRSGIRPGIQVADKIGLYNADDQKLHVYSDCGIVFYPERTYSLCIMVHSSNNEKSIAHIQHISKLVFDFIDKRP
jgi:beta-lactamase class A